MNIKDLLMLSMVKNIGPAFIKKNRSILQNVESCEIFLSEYKTDELESLSLYQNKAEEILDTCEKHSIKIISILEDTYPKRLLEISDPPSILFYKGNETLLNNTIAIIGTRKSTELGNKIAEKIGFFFSEKFSICNGLVEGIDEHAIYHNGRIAKNVVGIISGGLCYKETCSANHIKVIDDVLNANGLIISEFFPKQKEDKYSGSKASRIQAGLSQGLILVQSKVDGGSKYTLSKFAKLGRSIGVVHYPSSEEYGTDIFGANRLILEHGKEGLAQMIDVKKPSSLNVGSIIALSSKEDYDKLIQEIENREVGLF
jgi:DNA processing protein